MLKDKNSIEFNSLIFAGIYVILFFVVMTPIVIIGASLYPAQASQAFNENPQNTVDKFKYLVDTIKTMSDFLALGITTEIIRRKISMKVKLYSDELYKGIMYLLTIQFFHFLYLIFY